MYKVKLRIQKPQCLILTLAVNIAEKTKAVLHSCDDSSIVLLTEEEIRRGLVLIRPTHIISFQLRHSSH